MPTITETPIPNARVDPMPRPKVSLNTQMGVEIAGQRMVEAGADIVAAARLQQSKFDAARVLDAVSDADTEWTEAAHTKEADEKSKGAYFKREGYDAKDVLEDARVEQERLVSEGLDRLDNDRQRAAFKQKMAPRWNRRRDRVIAHMDANLELYEAEQLEKTVIGARRNAAINWADDDVITEGERDIYTAHIANAGGLPDASGKQKIDASNAGGHDPERLAQKIDAAQGAMFEDAARGALNAKSPDSVLRAAELLEQGRDRMDPKVVDELNGKIERQDLTRRSQDEWTRLTAKHGDDYQAAVNEARTIEEPELQKTTLDSLALRHSRDKTAEAAEKLAETEQRSNDIEDGLRDGEDPAVLLELADSAPTYKGRVALKRRVTAAAAGHEIVTHRGDEEALIQMTAHQLADANLHEFQLDSRAFSFWTAEQVKAKKGKPASFEGVTTVANLFLAKQGVTDKKDQGAFKWSLWQRYSREAEGTPTGKLAPERIKSMMLEMVIDLEMKGRTPLNDPDIKAYQVDADTEVIVTDESRAAVARIHAESSGRPAFASDTQPIVRDAFMGKPVVLSPATRRRYIDIHERGGKKWTEGDLQKMYRAEVTSGVAQP